jgi:hypothetical protein
MKVLVDNGVVSSSDLLEGATQNQELVWGTGKTTAVIHGFRRIAANPDSEQQLEIDALFTLGRLAREKKIEIYTYTELTVENWRRPRGRDILLNAFVDCKPRHCMAAIERTKFRSTISTDQWVAKGDSRDRKKGASISESSQVPFFEWLANLSTTEIQLIVDHAQILKLSDFETDSLHDIPWFQNIYKAMGSTDKHLPDCFHVWTARRNTMDALLTIEKKLPRTISQLESRRNAKLDLNVKVVRPTDLLAMLGVSSVDSIPIDFDRFYSYMEIFATRRSLLGHE